MRKLSLSILAASIAFIPAVAAAEQGGPRPNPPAGHSWRGGGAVHGGNVQFRHGGGMHPGHQFRGRRFQRGFVIPQFWFGPQFHVQNWQVYGFADPGRDGRWVRFYDDAYLIGHDGRVRDHRYGMDWDRYGEEWEDEDGVPAYRGRRGHHADRDDDDDDHDGRGGHHGGGHHGGGHMMQGGGYGYGQGAAYGGGYGYGFYAYPIVIETVTTSAGCGCSYEVVEEVVEVRQRARRRPPVRRPPPPRRPPPGERG